MIKGSTDTEEAKEATNGDRTETVDRSSLWTAEKLAALAWRPRALGDAQALGLGALHLGCGGRRRL
jgi:hypothetical protein